MDGLRLKNCDANRRPRLDDHPRSRVVELIRGHVEISTSITHRRFDDGLVDAGHHLRLVAHLLSHVTESERVRRLTRHVAPVLSVSAEHVVLRILLHILVEGQVQYAPAHAVSSSDVLQRERLSRTCGGDEAVAPRRAKRDDGKHKRGHKQPESGALTAATARLATLATAHNVSVALPSLGE